jgi:hypothetical protein
MTDKKQLALEAMGVAFCQHCKAMQKTNQIFVDCLYNPMDEGRCHAFCGSNLDANNFILALPQVAEYFKEKSGN